MIKISLPNYNFKNIDFKYIVLALTCLLSACKTQITKQDGFQIANIVSDSLFQSKQNINMLSITHNSNYTIDIGYNSLKPQKTSKIAKQNNAIAAINSGFFDIENGHSVTYFEKHNDIISHTQKQNTLLNGVIIMTKANSLKIEMFKNDVFYETSINEDFAIATGPLLLKNSLLQPLPNKKFVTKRHPRTCLCLTKDATIFVVIDGRRPDAHDMNLFQVQTYLLDLGCIDAINLDGGGSSNMWTKQKGIINTPSDTNGERPVANVFLFIKK